MTTTSLATSLPYSTGKTPLRGQSLDGGEWKRARLLLDPPACHCVLPAHSYGSTLPWRCRGGRLVSLEPRNCTYKTFAQVQDKRALSDDDSDDEIMDLTGGQPAPALGTAAKKAKSESSPLERKVVFSAAVQQANSAKGAGGVAESRKPAAAGIPSAVPADVAAAPPSVPVGKAALSALLAAAAGPLSAMLSSNSGQSAAAAAPLVPGSGQSAAAAAPLVPPVPAANGVVPLPGGAAKDLTAQQASAQEKLDEALDNDVGLMHTNSDEETFATYRPTSFIHSCFANHPVSSLNPALLAHFFRHPHLQACTFSGRNIRDQLHGLPSSAEDHIQADYLQPNNLARPADKRAA